MSGLSAYQRLLLIVQAAALLSLIIRLIWDGLHRSYPFFLSLLIAQAAQSAIPFAIRHNTDLYGYLFLITETLIVCFYALVVLELYSVVLGDLKGIASVARTYTRFALGAALLISVLLLAIERNPVSLMAKFYIFERAIVSSLLLFVFLITAFLVYFPIPLNRNVIVYSIGYAFYFLGKGATLFARNLGFAKSATMSNLFLTASTLCLLFWLMFLNRQGEKKAFVIGHRWDPGEDARLLKQIDDLNQTLLRTARK
jgi:hypothetical protein